MRQDDLETELDHELRAERDMLEHARRCLTDMRRRAESLTASSGGDWVSEEVLHWRIQQRIASLADDGSSGLFFGRIDDGTADRLLAAEIERPRIGPMRDIVATIQPEQDDLIRAPLDETIVVQGGPGTGKTAVGLHRIAYLLYEHRERLERDGVLMVGPSAAYLAFVHDVLPGPSRSRRRPFARRWPRCWRAGSATTSAAPSSASGCSTAATST